LVRSWVSCACTRLQAGRLEVSWLCLRPWLAEIRKGIEKSSSLLSVTRVDMEPSLFVFVSMILPFGLDTRAAVPAAERLRCDQITCWRVVPSRRCTYQTSGTEQDSRSGPCDWSVVESVFPVQRDSPEAGAKASPAAVPSPSDLQPTSPSPSSPLSTAIFLTKSKHFLFQGQKRY
jgi:hypothetical protein